MLRVQPFHLAFQLVEGADVGLGRSHHDVGVGAHAVHYTPALREAHGHLALRLGAGGHGVYREQQQLGAALGDGLDGLEGGVDGTVALGLGTLLGSILRHHYRGVRPLAHAAALAHGDQLPMLLRRAPGFLRHQRLQVLVEDLGLLVGQVLEALEGLVVGVLAVEVDAELLQALLEGVAPRQLAQDDLVHAPAHVLGAHDLVGVARLEHAVLVDARGVREGFRAHARLVRLHHEAGDLRHQAGGRHDVGGVDPRIQPEKIIAGAHRHDDFLERGIAGALAQAVDGALDLARAADLHGGERVGHRHAEVVVAVHAPHRLVRVGHLLPDSPDEFAELLRHRVAHGVRDVDGGGAFLDHRLEHAAEEIEVGARPVLGRELDVRAGIPRIAHREPGLLVHLLGRHAQLLFHVQRAGGDEGVDAPGVRPLQRVDAALDVAVVRAAQAAHGRVPDGAGDGAHRLEVAVGRGGKAGLDHVHAHALERARDAQLLVLGHGRARALLAVAHGGVEYDEVVLAHGMIPWPGVATFRVLGLWAGVFSARGAAAGRPARGAPGEGDRKAGPVACVAL